MKNNVVTWRDIVKINGEYFLEVFEVSLEDRRLNNVYLGDDEETILKNIQNILGKDYNGDNPLYDCGDFFTKVAEKHNISDEDEIETYLFDDLELNDEVCKKFDIAWLGGYINSVNI